jgi:uncharacterized protein YndB with AHSA1/START domain
MLTYEEVTTIDAPPKEVWRHLVNPDTMLVWMTGLVEIDADWSTEPAVGDHARGRLKIAGYQVRLTMEVTEAVPGESFAVRVAEGPFPYEAHYELQQRDGGTRLVEHGQTQGFKGFFGSLTDPLVIRILSSDARNEHRNLKLLLEER